MKNPYGKYEPSWYKKLPDEALDVYQPNLHLFFKAMFERQEVWYKRFILQEERPWTDDKFLANHKFTNVYREMDRNSQYMIKNILLVEKEPIDIVWKIMLFRVFNCPEFFEWMKVQKKSYKGILPNHSEYDAQEFYDLLIGYRETGNNPFTNAYLTNSQACPGMTRDDCYGTKIVPTFHRKVKKLLELFKTAEDAEEIIAFLLGLPSIAGFMAHEYYQDFTYIERYSQLQIFPFNQNDFTNVGPGASVGIRLIFPNLVGKAQLDGIYRLREMAQVELSRFGKFKYLNWDERDEQYYVTEGDGDLTLHAIEMWLCEFQKYWKMTIGEGKQRSKFIARTKEL